MMKYIIRCKCGYDIHYNIKTNHERTQIHKDRIVYIKTQRDLGNYTIDYYQPFHWS